LQQCLLCLWFLFHFCFLLLLPKMAFSHLASSLHTLSIRYFIHPYCCTIHHVDYPQMYILIHSVYLFLYQIKLLLVILSFTFSILSIHDKTSPFFTNQFCVYIFSFNFLNGNIIL
jgi:hypothetical protein